MNELEVHLDDDSVLPAVALVGRLFRDSGRRGDIIRFEYASHWLTQAGGFEIEPLLPLLGGSFHAQDPSQLMGIFQDCSPDRWGRMLMDRREAIVAREEERPRRTLRTWDYLVGVDDGTRMGALRFRVPGADRYIANQLPSAPPATSLRELEAAARLVEQGAGEQVDRQIRQLLAPGGSLGGARPKASFVDEHGELWLAKFPSAEDRHDVGFWEYLTHGLALDAGIQMPPARLLPLSSRGQTFAVKRFDRSVVGRRMYASAKTLLDMESDEAGYLDLAMVIEDQGAAGTIAMGLEQLFRRAVFNVLVGNRDDHLRNHGFLRQTSGWTLSPAFDVNPNPDKDVHVLAFVDGDPTPDSKVLLAQHRHFRLGADRAGEIIEEVRNAVRPWRDVAKAMGAASTEVSLIRAVIDPER